MHSDIGAEPAKPVSRPNRRRAAFATITRQYARSPLRAQLAAAAQGRAAGSGIGTDPPLSVPGRAPEARRARLAHSGRQLELAHGFGQLGSLLAQHLRRGGRLLDERRVLLRRVVELRQRLVDLTEAGALLRGCH